MHFRIRTLLVIFAPLCGCTSTYHPEYHPVTVTTVDQVTNAPVEISSGPSASNGAPVVVAPAHSAPPLVVPEPALADPEVVFRR